jgi:two-component system response regulator FlrC
MSTILIVEDDRSLAEALRDTLELEGYRVLAASNSAEALTILAEEAIDLVLSDVHMQGMDGHGLLRTVKQRWSEIPVLLMTAFGSISKAVEAMRAGASDYLTKPFEASALLAAVGKYVRIAIANDEEPVAADPRTRELFLLAQRVAQSEATVLILGESGTGKEVIARFLHRNSRRNIGPFVAINCAAIPENMLEAILFGYEKGAFTGAVKALPGKFEQAHGGMLLLDEISEMDLGLQAKLLRVLQEREVERLGGGQPFTVDVRVVATSNRDMQEEVRQGRFREDLYYRLNVFPLRAPPLRERPLDILPLAERSLARAAAGARRRTPTLSSGAAAWLTRQAWPGNVRELDNAMQRALILQPGETIELGDVAPEAPAVSAEAPVHAPESLDGELRQREYGVILEALKTGSRRTAAERLGISERTLRYKLARLRDAGFAVPERVGA